MRRGGRLVYAGAGTSGALASLDAAECGSTFGSPPGEVLAVITEQGADEDDRAAATNALSGLALRPEDCVVAVASAPHSRAAALAEHAVAVVVGPEVIRRLDPAEGRDRPEARSQHDLDGDDDPARSHVRRLMVGVAPANEELRERARCNVVLASGASEERVDEALAAAAGDARVALVSLLAGVDADAARLRLEASAGSVRKAAQR